MPENELSLSCIKRYFPEFKTKLRLRIKDDAIEEMNGKTEKRLLAGAETYGDVSFHRSLPEICDEIELEAVDVHGWGWILVTASRLNAVDSKRIKRYVRLYKIVIRISYHAFHIYKLLQQAKKISSK